MPDDRTIIKTGQRAKLIGLLSAALIAATPGIYSAWENAKQAYRISHEQQVRDSQEVDLQQWAKANKVEIDALKQNCVTHKELLEILMRWSPRRWPHNPNAGAPSRPTAGPGDGEGAEAPTSPAADPVGDLQRRIDNSKPVPKPDYPELKPADSIRQELSRAF